MRVPPLVLLAALTALAQPPAAPEIRGAVFETGSTTPIAGVEVTLYEFGPNADNFIVNKTVVTTFTDANGGFSLKPGHFGQFSIGAKKASYTAISGLQLNLTAAEPVKTQRLSLTRPAAITGRVMDRDGNPVANLRVGIEEAPFRYSSGIFAVTNAEGNFTASNLRPGAYLIHIQPAPAKDDEDLPEFTEEAFKIVDEDVEPSYWPGGVADPDQVLPINAAAGAIVNAGNVTVRKTPYYRVRIMLNRNCAANERWILGVRPANAPEAAMKDRYTACRKDALLTGVPPGSYELAVWSGRKVDRWALVPFVITDKNTQVSLTFNETSSVSGRVMTADGSGLPKLGGMRMLLLRPTSGFPPGGSGNAELDAAGKFTFDSVPWKTQWLSVDLGEPATFIKEIRYNGLPLRSHQFDTIPGAALEIVLDRGPAELSGTLKSGEAGTFGRVLLISSSETEVASIFPFPPFIFEARAGTDGRFQLRGIPPGEYRILIIPPAMNQDSDPSDLARPFSQAQKITLGRGEQKSIELQVK